MRTLLIWLSLIVLPAQELTLIPRALPAKLEHFPTAAKLLPETMAGGLALFDYNNDGRIDVFLANGADLVTGKKAANRLFRNDGDFHFTDVTEQAGLAGAGFAFGAAVADVDGDGWLDLYVPALPASQLFHNRGDGTFEDWSARLPQAPGIWTVAAGWFDYDRDGRPDLLLVHYLDWSLNNNPWCGDRAKDLRVYCHPRQFAPTANQLLHNLGNGKFEDVSVSSGIAALKGKGMSVAFGDADGDGWLDVFVTNDTLPCFLFLNQRDGRFREAGLEAGVSLPEAGRGISAMGAVFSDFDNDGKEDIALTALARETFPLYRNAGRGQFEEATTSTRLAAASRNLSGWGIALADLDNDGWKDLLTANAHVNDLIERTASDAYAQPNAIFHNEGGKRWTALPFGAAAAHRGLAVADLDGDGRLDVVVTALGAEPEVWRNSTVNAGNWIAFLAPAGSVLRIGNQRQRVTSAMGYSSSTVTPTHFGLAAAKEASVEITWPDGKVEVREHLAAGRVHRLAR